MHDHATAPSEAPQGQRIEPGHLWSSQAAPGARLWIDASEGASGDMLLAALIDAGADAGSVAEVLRRVAGEKLHLTRRRVVRGPFTANKIDVVADEPNPPARHLSDIRAMLDAAEIPALTYRLALEAFTALAEAEAKVHGSTIEEVHFHEVGALDSIGDIVGVCEAFRTLHAHSATCSTIAVGAGTVQTQHGLLSVPPPAVAELSKGWPIEAGGPDDVGELCTPTGMVLLKTLCSTTERMPPLEVEAIGVGAGTRIRTDRAGVVRAFVGYSVDNAPTGSSPYEVHEVAANVDDLDPRVWPAVIDRLLDAGAVDAWLVPIIMKKGRPAHTVTALAPEPALDAVADALMAHTSTIGVRISPALKRRVLQRGWVPVDVGGHEVRIKVSGDGTTISQATAEFADIEALADALSTPQRVALAQAQTAAWERNLRPGAPWPEQLDG